MGSLRSTREWLQKNRREYFWKGCIQLWSRLFLAEFFESAKAGNIISSPRSFQILPIVLSLIVTRSFALLRSVPFSLSLDFSLIETSNFRLHCRLLRGDCREFKGHCVESWKRENHRHEEREKIKETRSSYSSGEGEEGRLADLEANFMRPRHSEKWILG